MKRNKPIIIEFLNFIISRKAWWLAPIIIMLLMASILIIFSQSNALSPFIYALF